MADKSRDLQIVATKVYSALKPLDPADRKKVISSVATLLDIGIGDLSAEKQPAREVGSRETLHPRQQKETERTTRPVSLVEVVQDKKPKTNAQRIATFAYHREKNEGQPRFSREDLETYFAKAKEPPAANYYRDFMEAVKKGWIHEDGAESYLTTRGLEAVEAGFEGVQDQNRGRPRIPSSKRNGRVKPKKQQKKSRKA